MNKHNNIPYIRSFTAIIVVLGHVLDLFLSDGHYSDCFSDKGNLEIIHSVINSFHMPVFMSVSGYLFYFELRKNESFSFLSLKNFLAKKIYRLIVPFLLVMYFLRKPVFYIAGSEVIDSEGINRLVDYLKFGTTGHLWYLYILFGLFVCHYLFKNIIWKNKAFQITFIVLSIGFNIVSSYSLQGTLHHIFYYNLYFTIGIFIHMYFDKFTMILEKKVLLICLSLIAKGLYVISLFANPFFTSVMLCISACLDIVMVYSITYDLKGKQVNRIIAFIDNNSMGIYLFHPIFISLLVIVIPFENCALIFISCFILSILCSILAALLFRKINLKGFMGEK